jgi:putative hydrolase of the HAD superfamily
MDIKVDEHTIVVFDLDDTLYNELDFLKSAYRHIAQELEPKKYHELLVLMLSLYRSRENVFEIISTRYGLTKEALIEMYRRHTPSIKLFDGALTLLNEIKRKKGKIGMVTDGRVQTQMAKINALGISDLLDKIVISEEIGSEKPAIANFKTIENSLMGTTYHYIADNLKKDFLAPNALGWTTTGLIDNGMNIHYQSHLYLDQLHMPRQFFTTYTEVKIV